jgi:hypothetical protein
LAREISITIDQTELLNTMAILSTVIVVVAIGWVIAQLLTTRRRLRNGEIVVPPLFAATLVFRLFILVVWAMGASSLHLLWLFPLSFVLGIYMLLLLAGQLQVIACLGLLAGLKGRHEPYSFYKPIGGFSSVIMCHLTLYLLSPIEG